MLRQALYQTLHPCFLTNTGGNVRSDVLRMVQAASIYAPDALTIPLDETGAATFSLEKVARANGLPHDNAHDAMGDAEATIHLCRLLEDRAPDIWSAFMRLGQKAAVIDCLNDDAVLSLSAVYRRRPYSWLVTALGPNAANGSEYYVFELGHDPDALRDLNDDELAARLCGLGRRKGAGHTAKRLTLCVADRPEEMFDRMCDIILKGCFFACNAVAPHMIERGSGKIINIGSTSGVTGRKDFILYSATKAGVLHMTRSLGVALAPHGINVNAIAPGNTETPMNEHIRTQPGFEDLRQAIAMRTPSRRLFADPNEIAGAVAYLASDDARAMYGSIMIMDEGLTAGY